MEKRQIRNNDGNYHTLAYHTLKSIPENIAVWLMNETKPNSKGKHFILKHFMCLSKTVLTAFLLVCCSLSVVVVFSLFHSFIIIYPSFV